MSPFLVMCAILAPKLCSYCITIFFCTVCNSKINSMDKVELGVNWTVDNESLKAGMERSKKAIEGVGQSVETVEKKVNEGIQKNVSGIGFLQKSYEGLKIQAESYGRIIETSMDPKVISEYNAKLRTTLEEMAKIKTMGLDQTLSPNFSPQKWNGFSNSINQISRELPAFTYSFQTGVMAISNNLPILSDEISRMRKENQALVASGQKAVPVWKQVASSLFSWQTLLSVGITLVTVYGKEIGEWIKAALRGKGALDELRKSTKELNETRLKGSKDAQGEITALGSLYRAATNTNLAYNERLKAVKQIQDQYPAYFGNMTAEQVMAGKATGAYEKLSRAILAAARARAYENKISEISGKILENEDNILEKRNSITQKDRAKIKFEDDLIRNGGMVTSSSMMGSGTKEAREALAGADELEKANDKLSGQILRYQGEIDKLVAVNGTDVLTKDLGGKQADRSVEKTENLFDRILDSRTEVYQKIVALDREYARKSMESDEAEIQAVRDKFAEVRRIIEKENDEIQKYNQKNASKKGFKPVSTIDVSQLDPIQERAVSEVTYIQETKKITKQIEVQKRLWSEYEDYRNKLGKEKADERYRDELGGFESFSSYLNSIAEQEAEAFDAVDKGKATKIQQERTEGIKKAMVEEKQAEQKKNTELLALLIGYEQERKNLVSKYNEERAKIPKDATAEEIAAFDKHYADQIDQLDDANIQKLQAYKELFDGIEKLSDASARKVIANARKMLDSDTAMSEEERKKVLAALKVAETSLSERFPEKVNKVADEFSGIASSVSSVNQELGDMIGILSNVLRATANVHTGFEALKKGLADYRTGKSEGFGGILGKVGAIAGIAGPIGTIVNAVSSVVTGVINLFKASKESARKAAEEMQQYKMNVLEGEMEHNRLLRERARSQKDINDLTLEELKIQQELLKNQSASASNDFDGLLQRIRREGQQITGQRTERYGGFLGIGRKTRVVDITKGIGGYTYEQLEKLYETNKLTESTRQLFEMLRASKEEIDALGDSAAALDLEQLDRMSGGLTADSISGKIIQGLKDGRRAVKDFSGDLEDMVGDALLSAMSYTALDAPLKELVEKFRQDAKDGLSEDEINKFREGYEDIVQSGIDAIKEIERITGKQMGTSGSLGSESGRINRTVSEETASGILGFERARFDLAKQQLSAVMSALDFESKSYSQIIEQVRHLKAIEQNTRDTVEYTKQTVARLDSVNDELRSIAKNTKGGIYAG